MIVRVSFEMVQKYVYLYTNENNSNIYSTSAGSVNLALTERHSHQSHPVENTLHFVAISPVSLAFVSKASFMSCTHLRPLLPGSMPSKREWNWSWWGRLLSSRRPLLCILDSVVSTTNYNFQHRINPSNKSRLF